MSPENLKIHFIGIGGIGVSALAKYYLEKGNSISGSDLTSSEIIDSLKNGGARIIIGEHKSENIPTGTDLIIYSPAIRKNNPEMVFGGRTVKNILSYPEALGELTKKHFTVAVSGTHGKSTTTAMIALILVKAGFNPTVIVGTKLKEFGDSNFRMGGPPKLKSSIFNLKSEILIIEADEHFASFLNYWPKIIVLTNIESDHLDFYKNLNNIIKNFVKYIKHLPKGGTLVANSNDKNVAKSIKKIVKPRFKIQKFSLKQKEAKILKTLLKVPGEHNVSDALAALTAARSLNIPDETSFKSLAEYRGIWRRFEEKEVTWQGKKITIVSDYGHHPTEINATLKAASEKYPKKRIWCVFQPHQYQRTYYLFKDFVKVFQQAINKRFIDRLIITDIYDVAGREGKGIAKKVSAEKLINSVAKSDAIYLPKEKIVKNLKNNLKNGDVAIIMGAGDIYDIVKDLTDSSNGKKIQ